MKKKKRLISKRWPRERFNSNNNVVAVPSNVYDDEIRASKLFVNNYRSAAIVSRNTVRRGRRENAGKTFYDDPVVGVGGKST